MNRAYALALVSLWIASSAPAQVRLQDLAAGHPIEKKARFEVADITVGRASVLRLFLPLQNRAPRKARAFGGRNEVLLKVRDAAALSALRSVLLMDDPPRLRIQLVDRGLMARLSSVLHPVVTLDAASTLDLPLDITFTPCERVTRIVYTSIDSILRRELQHAGQTRRPVSLDEVFALLLAEKIEPFLRTLEPSAQRDPCFTTFTLLKWLRNQEAQGFAFSRYRVNDDLKRVLSAVATASASVEWRRYALQVDVTGYTDAHPFEKRLRVEAASTGVNSARDPLGLRFAGCTHDHLTGAEPQYVGVAATEGTPIGDTIDDNCELGAARAWAAAAFLRERLGENHVAYAYGTGGIAGTENGKDQDAQRRKIGVRITVKAAKEQ